MWKNCFGCGSSAAVTPVNNTATTATTAATATPAATSVDAPANSADTIGLLTISLLHATGLQHQKHPWLVCKYGLTGFKTFPAKPNAKEGLMVWNEEMRLWVHENQRNFQLEIQVHDSWHTSSLSSAIGLSPDHYIGSCFVDISKCLDFNPHTVAVSIMKQKRDSMVTYDRNITGEHVQAKTSEILDDGGKLHIEIRLLKEADVYAFFREVVQKFDTNGDSKLNPVEFAALMATLGTTEIGDEKERLLFDKMDTDHSGDISEAELVRYLSSDEFAAEPLSARLMSYVLDGEEGVSNMVSGVFDVVHAGSEGTPAVVDIVHTPSAAAVAVINEDGSQRGKKKKRDDFKLVVMDRKTGLTVYEYIPKAIKMSISLMYRSGFGQNMTDVDRVRQLLRVMSEKEGKAYDDLKSVKKIPGFIKQHNLNTSELALPLSEYKTFNEFFARSLKPGARPVDALNDASICVSPADCRILVFPTITLATTLWIKGNEFTVEKCLGPYGKVHGKLFDGGSMVIARLAPQDYHRFHFPATGKLISNSLVEGTLFTVNPLAIRESNVNVYTENKRCVNLFESESFGTMMIIAVGATLVGSIVITAAANGQRVVKGDEHGYFKFGGSTVLLLFQKGRIDFDADLVKNSSMPLETLIKVGDGIGRAPPQPQQQQQQQQQQ